MTVYYLNEQLHNILTKKFCIITYSYTIRYIAIIFREFLVISFYFILYYI